MPGLRATLRPQNPEIVLVVFLEKGHGGTDAAGVAREIFAAFADPRDFQRFATSRSAAVRRLLAVIALLLAVWVTGDAAALQRPSRREAGFTKRLSSDGSSPACGICIRRMSLRLRAEAGQAQVRKCASCKEEADQFASRCTLSGPFDPD